MPQINMKKGLHLGFHQKNKTSKKNEEEVRRKTKYYFILRCYSTKKIKLSIE